MKIRLQSLAVGGFKCIDPTNATEEKDEESAASFKIYAGIPDLSPVKIEPTFSEPPPLEALPDYYFTQAPIPTFSTVQENTALPPFLNLKPEPVFPPLRLKVKKQEEDPDYVPPASFNAPRKRKRQISSNKQSRNRGLQRSLTMQPPLKLEVNPHREQATYYSVNKRRKRKHGPDEPIKIRGLTRSELAKSSNLWPAEVSAFVKILPGERKNSYKFIAGRHVFHQCGPKVNGKLTRYDEVEDGELIRVQCGVRRCTEKGSFIKSDKPKWIVKPPRIHYKHETVELQKCSLGRLGMRAPEVAEKLLNSRKAMSQKVLNAQNLRGISRKILGEVKQSFGDCHLDDVNEMLYIRRKIRRLKGRCNKFKGEV